MSETAILARVRIALSKAGVTIWRNQTGALPDRNGRLVRFGLCEGSSDLIGLRTVTVTAEMAGTKLAQFVAVEVKTPGGRATTAQTNFLRAVLEAGGVAVLVRSPEEAISALAFRGSEPASL